MLLLLYQTQPLRFSTFPFSSSSLGIIWTPLTICINLSPLLMNYHPKIQHANNTMQSNINNCNRQLPPCNNPMKAPARQPPPFPSLSAKLPRIAPPTTKITKSKTT